MEGWSGRRESNPRMQLGNHFWHPNTSMGYTDLALFWLRAMRGLVVR